MDIFLGGKKEQGYNRISNNASGLNIIGFRFNSINCFNGHTRSNSIANFYSSLGLTNEIDSVSWMIIKFFCLFFFYKDSQIALCFSFKLDIVK